MPINDIEADGKIPGLAEARTGAMLSHPSIVPVIDFETTDTEAFLIMEAIEGPTLSNLIDSTPQGAFDLDILTTIAASVASALEFAHENQVLHLDIKPDNILIARNGVVKVSDFGISELADAQGFGGASGGTLGYMPPEQMQQLDLDQRCDEFSYAMIIYEMLTGMNPFNADSIDASLKLMKRFHVVRPSSVRNDVDPGIDAVMFTALNPDRDQRYETVVEFLNELEPYLGDEVAGAAKLKELVRVEDELVEYEGAGARIPLWERFSPLHKSIFSRIAAALLGWYVACIGFMSFGHFDTKLCLLLALIAAAAGAVKPALGCVVALGITGIGFIVNPQVTPLLGIALIVIAVLWLVYASREGNADGNCALVVAPLGAIFLTPLAPLLAGFALPPRRAVCSALLAGFIAIALSLACETIGRTSLPMLHFFLPFGGASAEMLELTEALGKPFPWIVMIGWVISALFMSLLCERETRVSSVLGAILASVIMIASWVCAIGVTDGRLLVSNWIWLVSMAGACVLMIAAGALGAPHHDKGED